MTSSEKEVRAREYLILRVLTEVKPCTKFWIPRSRISNRQATLRRSATAACDRSNAMRTVKFKCVTSTVGAKFYSSSRPAVSRLPCPAAVAFWRAERLREPSRRHPTQSPLALCLSVKRQAPSLSVEWGFSSGPDYTAQPDWAVLLRC